MFCYIYVYLQRKKMILLKANVTFIFTFISVKFTL